jgi:ectoine hydroxylase-related dioxygenase (phytanoyl-CoA dioxygenase family)
MRIDCRGLHGQDLTKAEPIRLAYDCLVREGYVILDHVIDKDKVAALGGEFDGRYARYIADREFDDTLEVGGRRHMITVDLAGRFADPLVYANPVVVAVARQALDVDAILESFGAIVSLPGSEQQHIHRDGRLLFDSAISPLLPAHALTFALPLVDMNDRYGTTAIWPGSHRWKERDETVAPEAPQVAVGSCILWDFRLMHGGTPNVSDRHRPIVYATYARRWYQDPGNFVKPDQVRLSLGEGFLKGVSKSDGSLFAHVR